MKHESDFFSSVFQRRINYIFLVKKCSYVFVILLCFFIFIMVVRTNSKEHDELENIRSSNDEYLNTALGTINIAEIDKNVFRHFGFELTQTDLIPKLKRTKFPTCQNIFMEWQKVANKGLTIDPPNEIPDSKKFLLNGYARASKWYFNETPKKEEVTTKSWNQTFIDDLIKKVLQNPLSIYLPYEVESLAVYAATKHYNITGQYGAVIGSQSPWVEAYILANGARHITTVDYHKISILHPQMDFLYALDLVSHSEKYYNKFDFIVSFSSIEHSGLGRYGEK